jgi:superfamily I DNA/RNA helicase
VEVVAENVSQSIDGADLEETERPLLYVACTRAKNRLLVTGIEPTSECFG